MFQKTTSFSPILPLENKPNTVSKQRRRTGMKLTCTVSGKGAAWHYHQQKPNMTSYWGNLKISKLIITLGSGLELLVQLPLILKTVGPSLMAKRFLLVSGFVTTQMEMEFVLSGCTIQQITLETLVGLMLRVQENITVLFVKSQLTQADKVNFKY